MKKLTKLLTAVILLTDDDIFLIDCLLSIKDFVDEIIIVNCFDAEVLPGVIGETFDIKQIKVLDFEFKDNYSNAWNFGIAHANGKFILAMNPSDRLHIAKLNIDGLPIDFTAIREQIEKLTENFGGLYVPTVTKLNIGDSYAMGLEHLIKIFRNDSKIRYRGYCIERVNESIKEAGFATMPFQLLNLENIGLQNFEKNLERQNKCLEILTTETIETGSWLAYMNLAMVNLTFNNKFMSLNDYMEAEQRCPNDAINRILLYNMAIMFFMTRGELPEAFHACEKSLAVEDLQSFPVANMGLIYIQQGNLNLGLAKLHNALVLQSHLLQKGFVETEFSIPGEQIRQLINQYSQKQPSKTGLIIPN